MPLSLPFLVAFVAAATRQQDLVTYLLEENRVLREHLDRNQPRLTDPQRMRLARAAKSIPRAALLSVPTLATPDTLLRWYRELVARKYTGNSSGPGRPAFARKRVTEFVLRFAHDNPAWGYTRIRDALDNLGHRVGRNTIARILAQHGIDPAPSRGARTSWATFLRLHWGAIAAADFFSVEVLTRTGLVRYLVLVVIDLKTRRLQLAGLSADANGAWMQQLGRNLTDAVDGFLLGKTKLIVDRDPLFTHAFRTLLKSSGIEVVRLPPRSPNLNAFAERAIRSIKEECISKVIPLSEAHLRHVLSEYLVHYHAERNHQGLGGKLIDGAPCRTGTGPIKRKQRLGGLLNYYHREAA